MLQSEIQFKIRLSLLFQSLFSAPFRGVQVTWKLNDCETVIHNVALKSDACVCLPRDKKNAARCRFCYNPFQTESAVITDKYISSVSMRLIAFHSSILASSLLFNQYIDDLNLKLILSAS